MHTLDSCWRLVPNPRAIQWWYLYLLSDDGEVWRVRLWVQGEQGPGQRCGVELCRTPLVGAPMSWEAHHAGDAFHGEADRLLVMVEACSLEDRDGVLHLALRLPSVELTLEAKPTVRWDDPRVAYDVDGVHGWRWTVPMLRGQARGALRLDGDTRPVSGTLFFDHVCADTRPSLSWAWRYRGWWWAVLWTPERSMLSLDVDFAGAPMRRCFEAVGDAPVRRLEHRPLRCEGDREPSFALDRDDTTTHASPLWCHPKPHRVFERPVVERVVNAWPGLRKRHLLGQIDGGHLYAEWMSLR